MKLITSLVVAGFVVLAATARAGAQTPDGQQVPLKGAPRVIVTDRSGQETIGRLVSWTPQQSGAQAAWMLAGIGVYGAVGAGIDALIPGRSPLWTSMSSAKSASGFAFGISPRERRALVRWRAW